MKFNTPGRFQSGLNSFDPRDLLSDAVVSVTPSVYQYRFSGNSSENPNFVNTLLSTGTAALSSSVLGGALLLTTAATAGDTVESQLAGAAFQFVPGFPCWFNARVGVDDITLSEFVNGVQNTNTNALTATDGVWFHKASGGTTVDLVTSVGGVATTQAAVLDLATLFAGGSYTATLTGTTVTGITVNAQPTGILPGISAQVTFSGGGGSGATAIAYVGTGGQLAFQLLSGGTGYTSSPSVVLTPQVPMGFWYDGVSTLEYGFGNRVFGAVTNTLSTVMLSPVVELKASTAAVRTLNFADLIAGGRTPY